jgi:hypothetical protein
MAHTELHKLWCSGFPFGDAVVSIAHYAVRYRRYILQHLAQCYEVQASARVYAPS